MTLLWSLLLGCVASAIIASASPAGCPAFAAPPPAASDANPPSLVGSYDGGQTEIAAMLDLGSDGRFHYALSYGALDEEAQGKWEFDGSRVLLTSDPVVPPRFVMLTARPLQARRLKLTLDLPDGMERQYFSVRAMLADGRSIERQLSEEGLELPLDPGDRVVSVVMMLPVYGLEGEAAPVPPGRGGEVHMRFDANDLGKVAFARTPLLVERGDMLLERHGRTIVFKHSSAQ